MVPTHFPGFAKRRFDATSLEACMEWSRLLRGVQLLAGRHGIVSFAERQPSKSKARAVLQWSSTPV